MFKRIAMVGGILLVGLTATGCSYPSDSEQERVLKDSGFYDCRITDSSDFFDNTNGSCMYRGNDGEVCEARTEITDSGNVITLKKVTCSADKKVDK